MPVKTQQDDVLERMTEEAFSNPNLPEDQKNAIRTLKIAYSAFSEYIAREGWMERVETIQDRVMYIVSIQVMVASFLIIPQTGVIGFVGPPPSKADPGPHPSHVRDIIHILAFSGLLLEIISVLFGLVASQILMRRVGEASRLTITKHMLSNDIITALKLLDATTTDSSRDLFRLLQKRAEEYHAKARKLSNLMENHSHYFNITSFIIAGAVFLVASLVLAFSFSGSW